MNINRKVQLAQLDLLLEVERICKKFNIKYFLVGGTLIGAVRHKGFIPWDDDIDVGMLREDYDKFIEVCRDELSNEYNLIDWNSDIYSPHPFLKLKIKKTNYEEEISLNCNINNEIFIDIFPYDNAPDNIINRKIQEVKSVFYKKMLLLNANFNIVDNKNSIKKNIYIIMKYIARTKKIHYWKHKFEKNQVKYRNLNTKYVVSLGGSYSYSKELKLRKILENIDDISFEGYKFKAPKEYHKYLTEIYGDYMKLPPEADRKGKHKIKNIDLGNYEIKNKCKV